MKKRNIQTKHNTLFRFGAILLMLLLLFGTMPASIMAEEGDGVPQDEIEETIVVPLNTIVPKEGYLADDDILLTQFIEKESFGRVITPVPESEKPKLRAPRKETLEGADLEVYSILKQGINEIAKGNATVASFEISTASLFPDIANEFYTAEDLKVTSIFDDDGLTEEADNALSKLFQINTNKILNALLFDCPYDLFWFDKTVGMGTLSTISGKNGFTEVRISKYTFNFAVSSDYVADYAETREFDIDGEYEDIAVETKKSTIDAVNSVMSAAEQVVKDAENMDDYSKLEYYKNYICREVTYDNYAANSNNNVPYGDPWQLVYVFDDNENTNVVCEGYSKAFKYLCDLTAFANNSIECHLVTGRMAGGTGAGEHMWNIVTIDGENYLVDVTNCDEGSIGHPDLLFLIGNPDGYSVENRTETVNGNSIEYSSLKYSFQNMDNLVYMYDHDTVSSYKTGEGYNPENYNELILATSNYSYHKHNWGTPDYTWAENNSSVTGLVICSEDNTHQLSETVTTSSEVTTQPTCTEKGETTYTAVFENEAFTTQTKTLENIDALDHEWRIPTYVWSEDNTSVTATRVCNRDASHIETETVTADPTTKEATCGAKGEITYISAAFENKAFTVQTKKVETDKKEHEWGVWTKINNTQHQRICANDSTHVQKENHKWDNGKITKEATLTENGVKAYTCSICKGTKKETIPKLAISMMDIGNVWTTLSPVQGVAFTTAFDPDGELDKQMTFADQWWQDVNNASKQIHINKATLPEVGHTYQFYVKIKPKTGYVFDNAKFKKFIYGGNEVASKNYTKTLNSDGTITLTWGLKAKANPENINDKSLALSVTEIADKKCTGKAITQSPVVKVKVKGQYVTLKSGTDYTLSYKNNTAAGTATVTITGKGKYTGSKSVNFKITHSLTKVSAKAATCVKAGNKEYWKCSGCGKVFSDAKGTKATTVAAMTIKATGNHKWDSGKVTKQPTTVTAGVRTYTCSVCKGTKTEPIAKLKEVTLRRVFGDDRFTTALAIAETYMNETGQAKLNSIIVASGTNFPDALAGSYLAKVKNAPIIIWHDSRNAMIQSFIKQKVKSGGTIYILGGTSAVGDSIKKNMGAYKFVRLADSNRYGTNLRILNAVGIKNEELLVCDATEAGKGINALIASATGKPILLVAKGGLLEPQKTWLSQNKSKITKITIIGNANSVDTKVESQLKAYGKVSRIGGKNGDEVSANVGKNYFKDAKEVFIATMDNYPDGLCGGPLAIYAKGPIILVNSSVNTASANYCKTLNNLQRATVFGGTKAMPEATARKVAKSSKSGWSIFEYTTGTQTQTAASASTAKTAAASTSTTKTAAASASATKATTSQSSSDVVYWVPSGEVYHLTKNCRSLSRSKTILSGTIAESGKPRVCKNCSH